MIGAAGFLGGALTAALERAGVTVSRVTRHDPLLTSDGSLVTELTSAATLYWAASSINPLIASREPERVAADLADFRRFCDAVHASPGSARVVLLSSGGTVYGTATTPPHGETTPPRPANDYGRAKLAMEEMLHAHEVPSVVVRIANAYGPGQAAAPGQGVIGHWLRAVRDGSPVTVYGDLSTVRDYVYVDDLVDALMRLGRAADAPPLVNIGSGTPTTLREVAEAVEDVVGRRLDIRLEPARSFDIPASWLDVTLAAATVDWRPATGLRTGVERMWRWLSTVPGPGL